MNVQGPPSHYDPPPMHKTVYDVHQAQQYDVHQAQQSPQWTTTTMSPFIPNQPGLEVHPIQPVPKSDRRICGLAVSTFLLSVALAAVIIIAAVGGGVGGTIAVQNAKSAALASANGTSIVTETVTATATVSKFATRTVTASPTSTNEPDDSTTRFSPPTTGLLAVDCPALTDSIQVIKFGGRTWSYQPKCGVDINGNVDILAVVSYSFNDCLKACSSYNRNSGTDTCRGVAFNSNLDGVTPNFGTCWLKNSTAVNNQVPSSEANGRVAGYLQLS